MSYKILSILPCASAILLSYQASSMAQTMKSAKECNEELVSKRAAISAAGESVKDFIDTCWWHTVAGQPTPVGKPADRAAAQAEAAQRKVASKPSVPRTAQRHLAEATPAEHASERKAQPVSARVSTTDMILRRKERRRVRLAARREADERSRLRQARISHGTRVAADRIATRSIVADPISGADTEARVGRRSYVALVSRMGGSLGRSPAVLLTSKDVAAQYGLDCWTQLVLFTGGPKHPPGGVAPSLVCDRKRLGSELNLTHLTAYAQISEVRSSLPGRRKPRRSPEPVGMEARVNPSSATL